MNLQRSGLLLGLAGGISISLSFIIGFASGALFDRHQLTSGADISNPDVRNFLAAYHLVTQRSYFRPFNSHRLMYAAIDGMLSATGDPHTTFLSPPENQTANQELNGSHFSGIGTIVQTCGGKLEIIAPLPNAPASRAGLRTGDIVTRINGKAVNHLAGVDAIGRIHGRTGTSVALTVRRGGHTLTVRVKRAQIPAITAYGRVLPGHLGQVKILSFGDNTAQQVTTAVKALNNQHVRGIVIDLRGNPGGYVEAAQNVSSLFLSSGVVAYERNSNKTLSSLPVEHGKRLSHVPLVILVDDQTASAAEITAAALRDHHKAILMGVRTYGKGSMQSVYSLSDGSTVRITDRLWLTPNKHSISGVGLKPNITVKPGTGLEDCGADTQLQAAERYLSRHVAG